MKTEKLYFVIGLLLSLPLVSAADNTIYVVTCGYNPCTETYTQQQAMTWYHTLRFAESFERTYVAVEDYRDIGRCWTSAYRRDPSTGKLVQECGE